jgi:ParB family transcriptional regulator, chromosome partitioning protein
LQRLAGERLEAVAEEVRAEGWNWTETRIERDVLELNRYDRLDPLDRPYTEDEQHEMDALTTRQDELAEQYDALSEDDENAYEEGERLEAELNAVTATIQALVDVAMQAVSPKIALDLRHALLACNFRFREADLPLHRRGSVP